MTEPKLPEQVNIYSLDSEDFWAGYVKGRPVAPESYWKRIYDYHSSHGGEFGVVNDVGSGVGVLSKVLGQKFHKVILTDPGEGLIQLAKTMLVDGKDAGPSQKYEFVAAKGENESQRPGSVDMVFESNSIHWMDVERAVAAAAAQLRPGGTCVLTANSQVVLFNPEAQHVWDRIMAYGVMLMFKTRANPALIESTVVFDSAYDAIGMPEDLFESGVQRIKINGDHPYAFRICGSSQEVIDLAPYVSRIGEHDHVTAVEDEGWYFDKDLQDLKDVYASMPLKQDGPVLEKLWKELSDAAEKDGGRFKGVWPCSVILATKKKS